jgi:hypothetical protein
VAGLLDMNFAALGTLNVISAMFVKFIVTDALMPAYVASTITLPTVVPQT